jgi:hypothetical protein
MRRLLAALGIVGLLSSPAGAASVCVTTSSAGTNLSVSCGDFPVAEVNWWTGWADTEGELCEDDSCEPGNIDCGCHADEGIFWFISRSDTDPYDNVGALGSNEVYLWLECTSFTDWQAAEFGLSSSVPILSIEAQGGFLSVGAGTDVFLVSASGCLPEWSGPMVAAVIHLEGTVSVDEMTSGSWGRTKGSYR